MTRAPAVLTGVAWAVLDVEQTAAPGRFWPAAVVPLKVVARVARLAAENPRPRPQPLVVPLTERELSVLRLLAEGHGNREIAAALFLAEGTVKTRHKRPGEARRARPDPGGPPGAGAGAVVGTSHSGPALPRDGRGPADRDGRARPALAVLLVPFWTGVISGGAFMVVGHVLMLPAMAAAMLLRRHDDTGSS